MNNLFTYPLLVIAITLIVGCDFDTKKTTEKVLDGTENVAANNASGTEIIYNNGITLTEVKQESIEVNLKLVAPNLQSTIAEGKVNFSFDATGITVGENGSINFSLNNASVKSYTSNSFDRNLPEGDFIFTSFLVDENGLSIKNKNAIILSPIKVGNYPAEDLGFEKDSSHILFNKPQGLYSENQKVILDFVLVNTELSEKGKRIKVLVNGTEFMLDNWKAYQIDGLPLGENVIRIDLVNDLGAIPGPFNRGEERTITLSTEAS